MRRFLPALVLLIAAPALAADDDGRLPDPALTPGGARSMDVEVVCSTRTSEVRAVTGTMKEAVRRRYGLTHKRDRWCEGEEACEIDHLIPLAIGGSNEIENLWPQRFEGDWNAHHKDRLETELRKRVCHGRLDIREAQTMIARDWTVAYVRLFGRLPDEKAQ